MEDLLSEEDFFENVAIVGSRCFTKKEYYEKIKSLLLKYKPRMRKIISGGAYGVDTFAKKFAKEFNISFQAYLPDWNKLGRSAGMVRNRLIVKNSDRVIAFWDGESKGTKNSIALAIKYNKDLNIFIFPKEEELLEYI